MHPFLKHKDASVSLPSENVKREHDEGFDSLVVAAEDLCKAMKAEDYPAVASALRAAFELLESEPHEEGEHI